MLTDLPYDRAHTCCFSGSRPEKLGFDWQREPYFFDVLRRDLRAAIVHAIDLEYTRFITGMSRGFDLWAAEEVLAQQRSHPNLQLIAAIAFDGMEQHWEPYWRDLYTHIFNCCEYKASMGPSFTPSRYHDRDRYMVNHSSRIICWNNGTSGGTAYTCQYAERRGLAMDNIHRPYYKLASFP